MIQTSGLVGGTRKPTPQITNGTAPGLLAYRASRGRKGILERMSRSVTRTRTARRGRARKSNRGWLILWPLLLGILVTPVTVRMASVFALSGPGALRLLYPWLLLTQGHVVQFSGEQADTLSEWILYGQFPLYGLIWLVAGRLLGRSAGPLCALLLHAGAVGAAIMMANR